MATDINQAKQKFDDAVEHFHEELKKLRTGRANAGMLDNVKVDVYGQPMPLAHIASVQVLDAQMIQVQPFDPNNLEAISAAIRDDQSLGLNPADDGKVVRLPVPPMTEERRLEVVRQLNEKVEEANISMRNIRHDVLKFTKEQKNSSELSEDDVNRIEKQLSEMMDEYKTKLTESAKHKEEEILKV